MSRNIIQTQPRELSATKRELLEKRLRGAFKATAREQLIARRIEDSPAPLSFAQESLWFIDQLAPGSNAYNVPVVLQLNGRLQRAILETALNEILRRHEILRATFPATDGDPTQVISPFEARTLPREDLREQAPTQREARTRELIRQETHQPFDLAHGPLVRWRLVRLTEEEHLLIITMHHIVSDGWSMSVFFRELQMLYDATLNDRTAPFPDLPIQYGDFAAWQRETMQGPAL